MTAETGFLLLWIILGALIGALVGGKKGRPGAGFAFGLLLGPLGWLVVYLGPDHSDEWEKAQREHKSGDWWG